MVLGHNGSCMEKVVESFTPIFHYALFILYIFPSLYLQSCLFLYWIDGLNRLWGVIIIFTGGPLVFIYTLSQFDPLHFSFPFPRYLKGLGSCAWSLWYGINGKLDIHEGKEEKIKGKDTSSALVTVVFPSPFFTVFRFRYLPLWYQNTGGAFCERRGLPSSHLSLLIFPLVFLSAQFANVGWGFPQLEMVIGSWEHLCIVYAKNRQSILVRWAFLWPVVFLFIGSKGIKGGEGVLE